MIIIHQRLCLVEDLKEGFKFKMFESISRLDVYIGLSLNGLFSGLGAAVGSWIANKHVIERTNRIVRKISLIKQKKK